MQRTIGLVLGGIIVFAGACAGEDPAPTAASTSGSDAGPPATTLAEAGIAEAGGTDSGPSTTPPVPEDKTSWTYFAPTQAKVQTGQPAVAVASDGTAFVAQPFTAGTPPLSEVPSTDHGGILIVHLDDGGHPLWRVAGTFAADATLNPLLIGVATDGAGGVYVLGKAESETTFGTTPIPAGTSYLVKLAAKDGALMWAQTFTGTSYLQLTDVSASGDVLAVSGTFLKSVTLPGGTAQTIDSGENGSFVARIDSTKGIVTWSKIGHGAKSVGAGGIAADASGAIYAGVTHFAAVSGDWGDIAYTGDGSKANGTVLAFDANGAVQWKKTIANATGDVILGRLAVRGATLAVSGGVPMNTDLGDGKPLGTAGARDPFVASFASTDGSLRWRTAIGNDLFSVLDRVEGIDGVAVDAWGQIAAVGLYMNHLTIDGTALPTTADKVTAGFGVKLDATGKYVWKKPLAGTASVALTSIDATPSGAFVATATLRGDVNLGDGATRKADAASNSLGVVGWSP